jgi:succinate dehydrogenase cytochrome b subunit
MTRDRRQFVLRRLHSLSGIVPIGIYLIFHVMLANASVLGGPKRFEGAVAAISLLPPPILLAIECLAIYLPLLFHAGYGFIRVREADLTNPLQNERLGAYLYTLQRLTGVIAFFFIAWHIWTTRVQYYFFDAEITFDMMHQIISQPINMAIFLIGALASVFHFTNGIWTFCVTWGITVGRQAQRAVRAASFLLFVVMGGTVLAILMAFRA